MLDTDPRYRPTLLPRYGWQYEFLANEYDIAMKARGDERRSYRG